MKIVALLGVMLFAVTPAGAQTSLGWPEMIELLAQKRTQAEACVQTLKSGSDKAALATGRLTSASPSRNPTASSRDLRSRWSRAASPTPCPRP